MDRSRIRTMAEFAAACGVSRPTLSKYFYDPSSVKQATRVKIEAALDETGYRPNVYAINQNRRRTRTVGVLVPFLSDPFFAGFTRALEGLVTEAGFRPVTLNAQGDAAEEAEALDGLRAMKPAGALLAPLGAASDVAALRDFAADVPTVLFDSDVDGVGAAYVGTDHAAAVALMVDHLCDTGAPPCFFEMAAPSNPNAAAKREAYRAAMARRRLEPMVVSVGGQGWDMEEIGRREGLRLLAEGGPPSETVLCGNDRLAIGLLAAAYEKGRRVGRGEGCALRVAGLDDHPFARFTCPPLTTVAQNVDAIARRSVRELTAAMEAEDAPAPRAQALFDGALIRRMSA